MGGLPLSLPPSHTQIMNAHTHTHSLAYAELYPIVLVSVSHSTRALLMNESDNAKRQQVEDDAAAELG